MATILIIDDSEEFYRLTSRIVERAGYTAVGALNGTDGIRMAITEQPDLILLDYMMPDKNGLEVFEELQANANTARIPMIMITAFTATH